MRYFKEVTFLVFLFGVFTVFRSPDDPDFGWHYKYGEYLAEHGQILRENIFSYTFTDYKWANSYWISQAVLYLTHHFLGHLLAGLVFAIPLSLASILYVRALSQKLRPSVFPVAMASLLLFVEFSGVVLTNRPMYFSSLFLMFLTVTLLQSDRKVRLWLLPPLFLIWANTHADFVLGLFILGLFVVDRLRKQPAVAIIGLLAVAATLINPFGVGLWWTLLKESHPYQFNHIIEWVPVAEENIYYFATYCVMLGLFVSALIGARRKLPLWYVLSLGLFCIFAARSQYFFRITVILGIPAFLVFCGEPINDLKKALSADLIGKFKVGFFALLALSVLVICPVFLSNIRQSVDSDAWVQEQKYPKEALDFILAKNIKGNVFNYYGWGGYMIWKYPQIKTFVDGRMPSWREDGKSVFEDYIKVTDAPERNIKSLNDYNVRWILYPIDSKLSSFLKESNSGWKEVYSDNIASVFVEAARFDIIGL